MIETTQVEIKSGTFELTGDEIRFLFNACCLKVFGNKTLAKIGGISMISLPKDEVESHFNNMEQEFESHGISTTEIKVIRKLTMHLRDNMTVTNIIKQ